LLVIDLDELLISENLRGCVTSFKKNIVVSIKLLVSTIKTILLVKGKGYFPPAHPFPLTISPKSNLNAN
jgi:hypothetical protein